MAKNVYGQHSDNLEELLKDLRRHQWTLSRYLSRGTDQEDTQHTAHPKNGAIAAFCTEADKILLGTYENQLGKQELKDSLSQLVQKYTGKEKNEKSFDYERGAYQDFARAVNFLSCLLIIGFIGAYLHHKNPTSGKTGWGFLNTRTKTSTLAHSFLATAKAFNPPEEIAADSSTKQRVFGAL